MPCTRSLHFQRSVDGKLDMIVHMRSNDVLWGFSAVNVFNFTLMQEYLSHILDMPLGSYYHVADNFHFYENYRETIEAIAAADPSGLDTDFQYASSKHISFDQLDYLFDRLLDVEHLARVDKNVYQIVNFEHNDLFEDWSRVFRFYWNQKSALNVNLSPCIHPQLQKIFKLNFN